MRTFIWYVWCFFLGAGLSVYGGLNVIDHPFWFIAVDIPLIIASLYAYEILWPRKPIASVGEDE